MASSRPLRLAPEWDDRFGRMLAVSAVAHALAIAGVIVLADRAGERPLPLVAYTVELTDPSALGGRVPPGPPAADLAGGAVQPPAPAPKPEASQPPAPAPEPKPEPTAQAKAEVTSPAPEPAKPPEVVPEPKPPEPPPLQTKQPEPPKVEPPKPEAKVEPPKPEPKPEPPKAEPPKPAAAKPEPPKPAAPKPEAKPAAPAPKPGATTPARPPAKEEAAPRDAYAAAAERWRARTGGGLGGSDTGTGPVGVGGPGAGGGGEVVGLEYVAYNQRIRDVIRSRWTSVVRRSGLVAYVYFRIAPDGEVSDVRIQQSSGDAAYDGSVLRAVQHANPLPPPPARYVKEFSEVVVDLHSEEQGGG